MNYFFRYLMMVTLILAGFFQEPSNLMAQNDQEIYLLVRSDDMGSSHAANVNCLKVMTEGISRSVEVMVPCPWFPEAAKLLSEHPGLDVGVHLTVTSEWSTYKWGPLSQSASLTDADGYFVTHTGQWYNKKYDLKEFETEIRKQIQLAINTIPNVTHVSSHMGAPTVKPELTAIVEKIAAEFGLISKIENLNRAPQTGWGDATTFEEKETAFLTMLDQLEVGKRYLFIEHPADQSEEMKAHSVSDNHKVAWQRDMVTKVFTSKKVMQAIQKKGIRLVSYADLAN